MQSTRDRQFAYDIDELGNSIEVTDVIGTIALINDKAKGPSKLAVVFVAIDKIIHNGTYMHNINTDKLNECKFIGNILKLNELCDCDIKFDSEYGSQLVCDGQFCVLASFDVKPEGDSFIYLINSGNLENIKSVSISFIKYRTYFI